LIRQYFKKLLPDTKKLRVDDSDLKASLKKYGIGHPKVKEVYDKMVFKYNRTQEMAKNVPYYSQPQNPTNYPINLTQTLV
jgi:hypothetical protein